MQRYPVKASVRAQLSPEGLLAACREHFGEAEPDGEGAQARFGALARLTVRAAGKELAVEVAMNPAVAPEIQAETIRRYNRFLEAVTGYSAKERASRLRKAAKGAGGA